MTDVEHEPLASVAETEGDQSSAARRRLSWLSTPN